jgi:ATP-dependent Clp protease adapter protein ClpS
MPGELVIPIRDPDVLPGEREVNPVDTGGPWVVILYNCDCHDFDEVIHQLQVATGCGQARAEQIAEEAHQRGRAIACTGAESECNRAAGILRSIGLQVETDLF